jgi:hypothetical protein
MPQSGENLMTYQNDPNRRRAMDPDGSGWRTLGLIAAVAAIVLLGLLVFMPRDTTSTASRDNSPRTERTTPTVPPSKAPAAAPTTQPGSPNQ